MRRGELWWASLGEPTGSEPGLKRPVLIIQADTFNASAIQTVVVVPLTSHLKLAAAPGNLRLSRRDTGLPGPSVVNVSQIVVIDRRRLRERIGSLPPAILKQVEEGVRLLLDL